MFEELKEVKYIKEMKSFQLRSEAYLEPKRAYDQASLWK